LAISGITYDPYDANTVYVFGLGGVCKSTDGGTTWSTSSTGLSCSYCNWVDFLAISPHDTKVLYAGTRSGKLFKSTDGGVNWSQTSFDLGSSAVIWVIVDKDSPDTLYVSEGTTKNWYRSTDAGITWTILPLTGLPESSSRYPYTFIQDQNNSGRFIGCTVFNGVQIYESYIPKFETSTFSVAKHQGSGPYRPGDTLDFTFTLRNSGPAQATNPYVRIVLPSFLAYVSGSATKDGVALFSDPISGNTITFQGNNLLRNESLVFTFQATINSGVSGTVVIDPTVTSDEDAEGTIIPDITISVEPWPEMKASAPVCGDVPPASPPDLFQIDVSSNSAVLYFTPAGKPYNYYFISYSRFPHAEEYGTQFVLTNYEGVTSFKVSHLAPQTTYYFKVRGGNGCMPGPWSNIMEVKTGKNGEAIKYYRYGKVRTKKVISGVGKETISPRDSLPSLLPSVTPSPAIITLQKTEKKEENKKKHCFLWNFFCF